jgi:hypothetical protein
MRSAPPLAWVYAFLVACGAAAVASAGHPWIAVAMAALLVGVVLGSRVSWLVAMLVHAGAALMVGLRGAWPWSAAAWAWLAGNLAACAALTAPSMRLDRSVRERAPRGSC